MKSFAKRCVFIVVGGFGIGVCIAVVSAYSQQQPTTVIHQYIIQQPPDKMKIPTDFYQQPHDFNA